MTSPRTWGVLALLFAATACWARPAWADTTSAAAAREVPAAAPAPIANRGRRRKARYRCRCWRQRGLHRSLACTRAQRNDLKEQVFRTRARLNLLKETVLGGVIGASAVSSSTRRTKMGASFRLIKAVYSRTACKISTKADDTAAFPR